MTVTLPTGNVEVMKTAWLLALRATEVVPSPLTWNCTFPVGPVASFCAGVTVAVKVTL